MDGVGELFGQSVDAVLRRPRAALVPFVVDVVFLAVGTTLFLWLAGESLFFPQGYRLPNFPMAVPHALPTVGDVMGPTPDVHALGVPVLAAAAILVLALVPLLAYAEAGFLGVLRAVYLDEADPLAEGRHRDAWSRVREAFADTGRRHFVPFLALRGVQAGLALAALFVPLAFPGAPSYSLGVLSIDLLLLYAPYAVVDRRVGALSAIRESVQLVSDHLASTLVALLFGLLVTGGISLLTTPLALLLGPAGPFVASALYAPFGTILALFLYKVYRSFRPQEAMPEAVPAPHAVPA